MPKLRLFEAFAGVGSQRMALRNIGADFESVGIMEVDRYGLLSYAAIHEGLTYDVSDEGLPSDAEMLEYMRKLHIAYNFSTGKDELPKEHMDIVRLYVASKRAKNYGDIRLVDEKQLPDMDFFTYSFPCKDFSVAGKRRGAEKGSGTKSALMWECERIIASKRPKYLMMENVPGMLQGQGVHVFDEWRGILTKLGYVNYAKVTLGSNYGVPQVRRRLIMFSVLGGCDFVWDDGQANIRASMRDILIDGKADDGYYFENHAKPCVRVKKASYKGFLAVDSVEDGCIVAGHYPTAFNIDKLIYDPSGMCPTVRAMNDCGVNSKGQKVMKVWDDFGARMLLPIEYWRAQGYSDCDYMKAHAMRIDDMHMCERGGRGIVVPMLMAQYRRLFRDYISR